MAKKGEIVINNGFVVQSQKANGKKIFIQRYYGWLQLKNIKSIKKKNAETMYQSLLLILYRVKAVQFVSNLQHVSSSIL